MGKNKLTLKEVKKLSPSFLLKEINKMKKKIKSDGVVQEIFKEYGLDIEEIDYIPMAFKNLNISATCDHGVIYFNYKLLCDGDFEKNYSYAIHEMTHFCQQTTGTKPTKSSDDGNYLDNPFEQEGFQNQIEYIANQFGEDEAENYVDDLLEHHEVEDEDEKDKLEDILLEKV